MRQTIDKAVANHAVNIFNDNFMPHLRKIEQKRKKLLTMDGFLLKRRGRLLLSQIHLQRREKGKKP